MTNGPVRSLTFYCPTHRIRFQAAGQMAIPCEQGGHTVGAGFPESSWWEFCCDCGTFWPTDPANGNLQRTECLVCERPIAKRYLCTTCQVVSIESSALVRRKTYSIQSESGITPECPGCSTITTGLLQEHDCAEASVRLLTSRSACPFCDSDLGPRPAIKPEQPAKPLTAACPYCGTKQKPDNRFCKRCGKPQPDAAEIAKANEEAKRHEIQEVAQRNKAAEARRRATAEALRLSEEKRRQERQAKRLAEEEAIRAQESLRRKEEQQRIAKDLQIQVERQRALRAAEEAARKAAAAEADQPRIEREARAAEQEQLRLKELVLQKEELVGVIDLPTADDEELRAESESSETKHQAVSERSLELEPRLDFEAEMRIVSAALPTDAIQVDDSETPDVAGKQDLPAASPPASGGDSIGGSTPIKSQTSPPEPNAPGGSAEFVRDEYRPSWSQSPAVMPQQPRRTRFWIAGLLVVAIIGVIVTAISLKPRVGTQNNSQNKPSPNQTTSSTPAGMVLIPGGEFQMGSDRPDADQQEKPAHKVTVAPFYIDVTEVTCEDYQKFVGTTGYKIPGKWTEGVCPSADIGKPVTGVDWYDASAYAKWANKRLPTEAEWEFAARGKTGSRYPWGDQWRKGAGNADNAAPGIAVVKTFNGTSPFQCYDMVGNAWEWTASKLMPYPGGRLGQQASDDLRVIRGGSWQSQTDSATTTYRFGWPSSGGKDYNNTSFRCAQDAPPPKPEEVRSP
jgi:formylglycine-generating enzyme required for sulfatase activity